MKNIFRFLSIGFILFMISCQPENKITPEAINNLPSGIIVKEKSISGNFDSVTLNISLFAHADTTFTDSIVDNIGGVTLTINRSKFDANRFMYFGKDTDLSEVDGALVGFAILFDEQNRIKEIDDSYQVNNNQPSPISSQVGFQYNSANKIELLPYYGNLTSGGCNIYMTSSSSNFYTAANGNDSLMITYEGPSCGAFPFLVDTVTVTFLNTPNNTNLSTLSYPSMPSTYYPCTNDYLQLMAYVPFPYLNGKLVDRIYYSAGNLRYTNSYTFDAQGRVKTATILFSAGREKLIEFNY